MIEDYLYPNLSDDDAINLIKEKITTNTPFSCIRFGDGEIFIMTDNRRDDSFQIRVCNRYGLNFPEGVEESFSTYKKKLWETFINTDLISISSHHRKHFVYEDFSMDKKILENRNIKIDELKICEFDLQRHKKIGHIEGMKELIQGKDIHIISPNKDLLIKNKIEDKLGVNVTYTDHNLQINYKNRNIIIESFKDIKPDIVLYGAAVNKDYGIILRDNYGKIALDMGSTLDAWAGIRSRHNLLKGNEYGDIVID